jgi:hypothetical protein
MPNIGNQPNWQITHTNGANYESKYNVVEENDYAKVEFAHDYGATISKY